MTNRILEKLNVRMVGTGNKFLVFGHGFGTDQSIWRKIHPYFTSEYRIILYDLACAGTVDPDLFDLDLYASLDPYVNELFEILDTLGVKKCIYVGHSISASIGIMASILRRSLFTKLVLLNASPSFLNDNKYHGGFEREAVDVVFQAMQHNYDQWVKGFAPLAVGDDVPEAVREFSRTLFNMRPDISRCMCKLLFKSDLRYMLGLVRVPCYIIQSERSSVPVEVAMYLKTHLGGGVNTVEILRTDGNLPQLTAPTLLISALRRALSNN